MIQTTNKSKNLPIGLRFVIKDGHGPRSSFCNWQVRDICFDLPITPSDMPYPKIHSLKSVMTELWENYLDVKLFRDKSLLTAQIFNIL